MMADAPSYDFDSENEVEDHMKLTHENSAAIENYINTLM
jgi:hypothetical protein